MKLVESAEFIRGVGVTDTLSYLYLGSASAEIAVLNVKDVNFDAV